MKDTFKKFMELISSKTATGTVHLCIISQFQKFLTKPTPENEHLLQYPLRIFVTIVISTFWYINL